MTRERYKPDVHRRGVVFTDDEAHDTELSLNSVSKIYTFDLAGHGNSAQENGRDGRFVFGGYSDASMRCVTALESAGHTGWAF